MPTTVELIQHVRRFLHVRDTVDFREFLPGALEAVETPPSPTGRLVGLLIVVFFTCAVVWAFFGRVDILATAQGRLLPEGDVKTIQPLESGVVRAIHVKDGDHVRAGDILVELDPTDARADGDRLSNDLGQAKLDVARLVSLKRALEFRGPPVLEAPEGAQPERIQEARANMLAQWDQAEARTADLTQQIGQKRAERAEVDAQIEKIRNSLPLLEKKEDIHRDLTNQGYGTSLSFLDAQQQVSEARHELNVQTQRRAQADSAAAALERQRAGARSQFAANVLSDLRKAEDQVNEMSQELVKARFKSNSAVLRSPIDGVVDQMAIHTLRGVVTPAQHLMIVVPDAPRLIMEAQLTNADIGFVHVGQPVKVKVETFNFTRYGLLDGRVIDVSRDVISEGERLASGAPQTETATQRGNSPSYIARIQLARSTMLIDGRPRPLQPGMVVTAEIRTGDRAIIDYILSPIARRTEESFHER